MQPDTGSSLFNRCPQFRPEKRNGSVGLLSRSPLEIRRRIYSFTLPRGVSEVTAGDLEGWLQGLGYTSGFYYPLAGLGLLSANKQVRGEALPLAYSATRFQFGDMDCLIRFLLAIGRLRENIESIDFPWASTADVERRWELFPERDDNYLALPELHVESCVLLLKQCKRLRHLRVRFDEEVLATSKDAFEADAGIRGLCSLRRIPKVEICGLDGRVLKGGLAAWLKGELEKSGDGRGWACAPHTLRASGRESRGASARGRDAPRSDMLQTRHNESTP